MNNTCFNEKMRQRTKSFSTGIYIKMNSLKFNDLNKIMVRQMIRSSSSVAANFRSAARGRSEAEFYPKMYIVVEEGDGCLSWLDYMAEVKIFNDSDLYDLRKEALELLSIFSTIKKKLKLKKNGENTVS
jgi:four helix bundle protein